MTDELTDISGICPTVKSQEVANPVYSEEYEEYVCSMCEGSLADDEERAIEQFGSHATKVGKISEAEPQEDAEA